MIGAVRPGCCGVDGDGVGDGECWAMVSSCRSDWSFPERIIREGCNASAADGAARNNPPPRDGTTGWGSGKGVGEGAGSEEQEASHLRVALRQADPGEERERGGKEEPGILQPHLRGGRAAEVTGQQDGADDRGARQGVEDGAD